MAPAMGLWTIQVEKKKTRRGGEEKGGKVISVFLNIGQLIQLKAVTRNCMCVNISTAVLLCEYLPPSQFHMINLPVVSYHITSFTFCAILSCLFTLIPLFSSLPSCLFPAHEEEKDKRRGGGGDRGEEKRAE